MNIPFLGAARFPSPLKRWVNESERVPATILRTADARSDADILFELAGARKYLFFRPSETRAAIVTCGGLCPGLNDVIRSLFFEMHHAYGVKEVLGFRLGIPRARSGPGRRTSRSHPRDGG
jgi:6-phosphofructokinase 1